MNAVELIAAAMRHDQDRLSVTAQNLTNATTPGYKRQVAASPDFSRALGLAAGRDVPAALPATDLRAGVLRATGAPLDLAIEGDGFFVAEQAGSRSYTRAGSFSLDARGRLVTASGAAVQGERGDMIIDSPLSALRIQVDGRVMAGEREVDRLRIVQLAADGVRPTGGGFYAADDEQRTKPADDARVRAGMLEASNVDSTREMTAVMETVRHHESMVRALQGYDDLLDKAIRKLGDL